MPPAQCTAILEIDCRIKPEKRREFRLNLGAVAQSRGFKRSAPVVYEDQNEPGHLLWIEEWSTRQDLEAYLESNEFLALLGGLKVLGTVEDCRIVDLTRSPAPEAGKHSRAINGWRYIGRSSEDDTPPHP